MALMQVGVLLVTVAAASDPRPTYKEYKVAKSAEQASAGYAEEKQAKMAAVDKVVSMLEDLKSQVLQEGEEEAKTYNTFACWCKTTMKEKQEAIASGKDDKSRLSATITKLSELRKELDTTIAGYEGDIAEAQQTMKETTTKSDEALAKYSTNEEDLAAAVTALKGAIKELKSSKTPSLLQLQGISQTIRHAALMADALGLEIAGAALLQDDQAPEVEMENYKFHSDSIIETLEKLLAEFTSEKNTIDAEEVKRVHTYDILIQEKTDFVNNRTKELQDKQKEKSQTSEDIAMNNQQLSTVSATLLDDMEYLSEVSDISSKKAQTWDQRSKVRADELHALTAAIEIVRGTVAASTQNTTIRFAQLGVTVRMADAVASSDNDMEAIEASAEEAEDDVPMNFLQRISRHQADPLSRVVEGRQEIVQLLRSSSQQLKSTLLSSLASEVASQESKDVFAKVKVLIQELIERLLAEAAEEATQKGWCTKAMADSKQKREYAAEEVSSLNANLAELEATHDKLVEELGVVVDEIAQLKTSMADAENIRTEEKAENKNTVTEAEAGLAAVNEAIKILTRFYATAAKETVEYTSFVQGPKDDMPDSGFEAGEAYKGLGGESNGIIGMLEVIEGDFIRTIKETEKAEEKAEEDHLAFMTESGKSLAEKEVANKETLKYKDDTEIKVESAEESLKSQMVILKTSIKELMELQTTCVDTGMSYADRVERREGEIKALNKALCILNAYASYGPEGLADAC